MQYIYAAKTARGQGRKGTIHCLNKAEARSILGEKGLKVEKLSIDLKGLADELWARLGYVPFLDKVLFTKHLSVMVKAGLPLDESLRILREQASSPAMKSVIRTLIKVIESGSPLSDGLRLFPKVFSDLYVNVIRAGERSGNLQKNLEDLSVQLAKSYELRSKVRSAMAYPVLVLISAVIIGLSLAFFVLPKILRLFKTFKVQLPLTTRVLIWFAELFDNHALLIALIVLVLAIFLPWLARRKSVRPLLHKFMIKIPVFGRISVNNNLALFCRTLGTSLTSGLPIIQAIDVTSKTFENLAYRRSLAGMSAQLQQGRSLSSTLAVNTLYPPIVYRMIAVGERTGKLDEVLMFLAEFYESEVDVTTKNLSTIIEPLLLIVIGLIVGGLALAIISPIYQITGSIGGVR